MKHFRIILLLLLLSLAGAGHSMRSRDRRQHFRRVSTRREIMFEHLLDGYGWEVPFDHHHRIPLPVILYCDDGWHCFSSSHIQHGEPYTDKGVTFVLGGEDSRYPGKIVELTPEGEKRPWDFSITKNVAALFITVLLVAGLMFWACGILPPQRNENSPQRARRY